jgi:hypothetical protein
MIPFPTTSSLHIWRRREAAAETSPLPKTSSLRIPRRRQAKADVDEPIPQDQIKPAETRRGCCCPQKKMPRQPAAPFAAALPHRIAARAAPMNSCCAPVPRHKSPSALTQSCAANCWPIVAAKKSVKALDFVKGFLGLESSFTTPSFGAHGVLILEISPHVKI